MEPNPLATPQPRIDKVLSLIRKAMIINQTSPICIDVCWYAYTKEDIAVEFIVHATKDTDLKGESIYQPLLWLHKPEKKFQEEYAEIRFVLNHFANKGSFPKIIPDFSDSAALQRKITKIKKQLGI